MLVRQGIVNIHIFDLTLSRMLGPYVLVLRSRGTRRVRVQRHWTTVTEIALRRHARQLLRLQQRRSRYAPMILRGGDAGRNADGRDRRVNCLTSVRARQTNRGGSGSCDGWYGERAYMRNRDANSDLGCDWAGRRIEDGQGDFRYLIVGAVYGCFNVNAKTEPRCAYAVGTVGGSIFHPGAKIFCDECVTSVGET